MYIANWNSQEAGYSGGLLRFNINPDLRCICLLIGLGAATIVQPRAGYGTGSAYWFGNDARTAAMGGGGEAVGQGPGNVITNPALMSYHPGGVWFGFAVGRSWLAIEPQKRPSGFDVTTDVYRANVDDWSERPVPSILLTASRGATKEWDPTYLIHLAAIGEFFTDRLYAGIAAIIPVPALLQFNGWFNDEREQHFTNRLHFERFGEFDSVVSISPAVSYAPLEWFSLGVAVEFEVAMNMGAGIYLPRGDNWEYAHLSPSGKANPSVRPIAGLGFKTPFGLKIGAVYRHQSYLDMDMDIMIRIWSVEEGENGPQNQFRQSHHFVSNFKPAEIALAASYSQARYSVELASSWERWSTYLDRHGNRYSAITTEEESVKPVFKDVFSLNLGGEFWLVPFGAIRAGLAYYPSPMPDQRGRYNYVDNRMLVYSVGAGFRFGVFGYTINIDLALQLWHMLMFSVHKYSIEELPEREGGIVDEVPDSLTDYEFDEPLPGSAGLQTNNPGFPGYDGGGVLLNFSFMVGMEFD